MNKLAWSAAAAMLAFSFVTNAAPDPPGTRVSGEVGSIYEWVDDAGVKHASDTVPDRYKSVARRVDPSRFRVPAAEQAEAERQAAVIKANAASVAPLARPTEVTAQAGPSRATGPGASSSAPSASECAAMRKRFAESQTCFVGFSNPDGTNGFHSCANEVIPDPEPVCGRN
jgi:hypothetical protein